MFNFLRTLHTIFHSGCANFLSPPTVHMGFLSPHPYQYLLFVVFLIIAILPGVRWYLVLIFVSLTTSDVERLFMYLLIISMSFLEKRLFRLPIFWLGFLGRKGCWIVWVLGTFSIWTPYQRHCLHISSPTQYMTFSLVGNFLHCAKAFQFDVVLLVYFCFYFLHLRGHVQKILTQINVKELTTCVFF